MLDLSLFPSLFISFSIAICKISQILLIALRQIIIRQALNYEYVSVLLLLGRFSLEIEQMLENPTTSEKKIKTWQ